MGVFDDAKLGQLDWMTQMTETIDSDLNCLLAKLPDRTPVTIENIIEGSSSSYLSLSVRTMLTALVSKGDAIPLSWEEDRIIESCFTFEVSGEPEVDLRDGEIRNGEIFLIKTVATLSDEQLTPLMGKRGIEVIRRMHAYDEENSIERLNEILDILGGCSESMKNRSAKKKLNRVKERLEEIFTTNEWRIRDMALANKVSLWIRAYITTGSLSDLVNLTKLKVMTHNNMPIYSVKEEQ